MHIWTDLALREFVFFLTLVALGVGPAAFLSERVDSVVRLVLAPAFGLAVGICLTLSLVQWLPVEQTYWVLYPAAAVSVALAGWRVLTRRTTVRVPLRELLQIVLIAIAVLGPASSTLHARWTAGPVAFNVYDTVGYVSEIDGQQTQSVVEASRHHYPWHNLTRAYWDTYASGYQNMDASALEGSVNDILGVGSTDTQSPFMIVLVLVAALAAFGAFRYLSRSRSWAGVLAGALFGGPFFLQLWADSSQAALAGLGLVTPMIVVGLEALRGRIGDSVLAALLLGGLLSAYPLFAPGVVVAALIVLVVWAWQRLRARPAGRRRPRWADAWRVGWRIVLIAALAAAITPVAFWRDVVYWKAVLGGGQSFAGLPNYPLNVGVVPGWLLQTRQLYYLPALGVGGFKETLWAILVPIVLLAVIAVGLLWRRQAAVLLALAAVCALLGEYSWVQDSCHYCVGRNLLPIAPLAIVALALGIAAVTAVGRWWAYLAGAALAAIVVVSVGDRARVIRKQILGTAYFMDSADRLALDHLPRSDVPVLVEGYGTNVRAPGEMPLVLALVNERTGGRASVALDSADYAQNAYIGPADQPRAFDPDYRYVLTRLAGIRTDRKVIARFGGIALQERVKRLDVTPVADIGTPFARDDPSGTAYVQGALLPDPLRFVVAGNSAGRATFVRIEVTGQVPITVPRQSGVSYLERPGHIHICMRANGGGAVRHAGVRLVFQPQAIAPGTLFRLPLPTEGVQLVAMRASHSPCR